MVDDCNWQTADVETVFSVHRRRVQQPGMELHPFLAICTECNIKYRLYIFGRMGMQFS